MRGHVHKRGSTWGYVVDVGRDPATGKRKQRTKGGFRTRAAAEDALTEVLNEIRSGTVVAPSSVTLEEYLTEWLTTVRPQLRETTWASYGVAVQRICWGLGVRKLQALTAVEVERFYARLVNEGGPAGRPLAAKTVRNTHIVLHRALADAERLRLVMRNVAHLARPPAVPHVERATWTADELAAFLEHVSGDRLFAAYVLLAAYEGMRVHEIAKVRGEDFAGGEVRITGKGSVSSTVPLHPHVAALVERMPRAGYWFPSDSPEGHVSRVSVSLAIGRAMKRAGVTGTPHGLRHHFGTQVLRASGGDLRTTQRALRHASPATTAIYTQVADEALFRAIGGIPAA